MFSIFFLKKVGSPSSAETTLSSNSFLVNFMPADSPYLFLSLDINKGVLRTQAS
jgi:hypothetical protein